jgi:hypothetical protein
MEVSFGANETAVSETPVVPTQESTTPKIQVPAVIESGLPTGPSGLVLGDKLPDFKDIILPRINLVQNIGDLADQYDSGSLLLTQMQAGSATVLFEPAQVRGDEVKRKASPPVNLTVFGFRPTRYVQKVKGGERGLIVDTEAEVRSNGGTLDYKEWKLKEAAGMKLFGPLADAVVAIRRPEHVADDDTVFTYEVEGVKYALALWSMKFSIYTAAAKGVFFTARALGCLKKGGYPSWNYAVTTKEKDFQGGNRSWVPVCLPLTKNTEGFLDFVRAIIG